MKTEVEILDWIAEEIDRAEVNWNDTRKSGGQNTSMAGAYMGRLECLEDLKNFLKGEDE